MSNISLFINSWLGQTKLIQIDPRAKSQELYLRVSQKVKVDPSEFIIAFNGKPLLKSDKTLNQLSINNQQVLFVNCRLKGGDCDSFQLNKLAFNSLDKSVIKNFNSQAPDWRKVTSGVNFFAKCFNKGCEAQGEEICIPEGIGIFMINAYVHEAKCPLCKKKASDVSNFGYFKCKLKVRGKKQNEDKIFTLKDTHKNSDEFKTFAGKDQSKVRWDFLIIQAQQL